MLGLVKIFHDLSWPGSPWLLTVWPLESCTELFMGILWKSCSSPLHPLEQTRNLRISNEEHPQLSLKAKRNTSISWVYARHCSCPPFKKVVYWGKVSPLRLKKSQRLRAASVTPGRLWRHPCSAPATRLQEGATPLWPHGGARGQQVTKLGQRPSVGILQSSTRIPSFLWGLWSWRRQYRP